MALSRLKGKGNPRVIFMKIKHKCFTNIFPKFLKVTFINPSYTLWKSRAWVLPFLLNLNALKEVTKANHM